MCMLFLRKIGGNVTRSIPQKQETQHAKIDMGEGTHAIHVSHVLTVRPDANVETPEASEDIGKCLARTDLSSAWPMCLSSCSVPRQCLHVFSQLRHLLQH